eukprot:scaffold28488_cov23-Tisochrysis_lutea.AAC.1
MDNVVFPRIDTYHSQLTQRETSRIAQLLFCPKAARWYDAPQALSLDRLLCRLMSRFAHQHEGTYAVGAEAELEEVTLVASVVK